MTDEKQPTHDLVVRARRTVLPDGIRPACVVIDDQTITAIEDYDAAVTAAEEIAVPDDQVLMPGLVDSHVHVNEPGRTPWEGYESATRAALAGGITTIIDMPLNSSPPTTTIQALEDKRQAAEGQLSVDVGLWGGAVPGNVDQLEPLWGRGVFGFKCFTAHSGIDEYGCLGYEEVEEAWRRSPAWAPSSSSTPRTPRPWPPRPRTSAGPTPGTWPHGPERRRTRPSRGSSMRPAAPVPGCTSSTCPPPRPCR